MIARFVPHLSWLIRSWRFPFHLGNDLPLQYVDELPARMAVWGSVYAWGYLHREDASFFAFQPVDGPFGYLGDEDRRVLALVAHVGVPFRSLGPLAASEDTARIVSRYAAWCNQLLGHWVVVGKNASYNFSNERTKGR